MSTFRGHLAVLSSALLALGACAHNTAPGQRIVPEANLTAIPSMYQGHWSNSLANCGLDAGDYTQWFFLGPETAGSFEHMYPVRDIAERENGIEFTTQFGQKVSITNLEDDRATLQNDDAEPLAIVKCPDGSLD